MTQFTLANRCRGDERAKLFCFYQIRRGRANCGGPAPITPKRSYVRAFGGGQDSCRYGGITSRYQSCGFEFLANGWLERALANQKDLDVVAKWWGRDDWTKLRDMSRDARRDALVHRLKKDLKYKSVKAWPIYERENGGAIMHYLIHATDHPEAPKFMSRAYRRAVYPLEPLEQLKLELEAETKGPHSHPPSPLNEQRSA